MALITCVKCTRQYSDTCDACVHCGYTPRFGKCPECGTVCDIESGACSYCGMHVNRQTLISMDANEYHNYYLEVIRELNLQQSEEDRKQYVPILSAFGDYEAAQAIALQLVDYSVVDAICNELKNDISDTRLIAIHNELIILPDAKVVNSATWKCLGEVNRLLYDRLVDASSSGSPGKKHSVYILSEALGDYENTKEIVEYYESIISDSQKSTRNDTKKNRIIGFPVYILLAIVVVFILLVAKNTFEFLKPQDDLDSVNGRYISTVDEAPLVKEIFLSMDAPYDDEIPVSEEEMASLYDEIVIPLVLSIELEDGNYTLDLSIDTDACLESFRLAFYNYCEEHIEMIAGGYTVDECVEFGLQLVEMSLEESKSEQVTGRYEILNNNIVLYERGSMVLLRGTIVDDTIVITKSQDQVLEILGFEKLIKQ